MSSHRLHQSRNGRMIMVSFSSLHAPIMIIEGHHIELMKNAAFIDFAQDFLPGITALIIAVNKKFK